MTQTFDYQIPRITNSPLRETVGRHASRNGGGLLFMAVFFTVATWFASRISFTLPTLGLACTALWHTSWGIFNVIAAVKIVRPDPFWEKAIAAGSVVQAAIIAVCTVILVWALMVSSPHMGLFLIVGYAAIYIFSFLRLARLAAKLRNEG